MYALETQLELQPNPALVAAFARLSDPAGSRTPENEQILRQLTPHDMTPTDVAWLGSHVAQRVAYVQEELGTAPETTMPQRVRAQLKMASWIGFNAIGDDATSYESVHKYLDHLKLVAPVRSRVLRLGLTIEKFSRHTPIYKA